MNMNMNMNMKIDKDKFVEKIIKYFEIDMSKENDNFRKFNIAIHEAKDILEKKGCIFHCGPSTKPDLQGFIAQITNPKKSLTVSSHIFDTENEALASSILKYLELKY